MSGGIYNYLYCKDSEMLLGEYPDNDIEEIVNRLAELGYEDASKESYRLLQVIKQSRIRVQTIQNRLSGIWKAVEWYDSGDWGKESIEEAVKNYRESD